MPTSTPEDAIQNILQQLLITLGLGTDPTLNQPWPVFRAIRPDKPDNLLVVSETAGIEVGNRTWNGRVQVHYGFQVLVRSSDSDEASKKARLVWSTLNELVDHAVIPINSNFYCVDCVTTTGDVINMGMQQLQNRLHLRSVNAIADIKQLS